MSTISFTTKIQVDEIISENERLQAGARRGRGGRWFGYLYCPPYVKEYKKVVESQLRDQLEGLDIPKDAKITMFHLFIVNKGEKTRDTTNFIKIYEDAFKDALGVDDSRYKTQILDFGVVKDYPDLDPEKEHVVTIGEVVGTI